jgi:asparagine synthase (glutamine-hydrolysing)
VPFARWTRQQWNGTVRDVLLDRRTRERGVIDAEATSALLRDHEAGRTDGWDRIWMLLNLELWFRTFIDGDGIQTLAAPAQSGASPMPAMARSESVPSPMAGSRVS